MIDKDDLEVAKSVYMQALKGEQDYYRDKNNEDETKDWNLGWQQGLAYSLGLVTGILDNFNCYKTIDDLHNAVVSGLKKAQKTYRDEWKSDKPIYGEEAEKLARASKIHEDGFLNAVENQEITLDQAISQVFYS